jgi:hypothetical protein
MYVIFSWRLLILDIESACSDFVIGRPDTLLEILVEAIEGMSSNKSQIFFFHILQIS